MHIFRGKLSIFMQITTEEKKHLILSNQHCLWLQLTRNIYCLLRVGGVCVSEDAEEMQRFSVRLSLQREEGKHDGHFFCSSDVFNIVSSTNCLSKMSVKFSLLLFYFQIRCSDEQESIYLWLFRPEAYNKLWWGVIFTWCSDDNGDLMQKCANRWHLLNLMFAPAYRLCYLRIEMAYTESANIEAKKKTGNAHSWLKWV